MKYVILILLVLITGCSVESNYKYAQKKKDTVTPTVAPTTCKLRDSYSKMNLTGETSLVLKMDDAGIETTDTLRTVRNGNQVQIEFERLNKDILFDEMLEHTISKAVLDLCTEKLSGGVMADLMKNTEVLIDLEIPYYLDPVLLAKALDSTMLVEETLILPDSTKLSCFKIRLTNGSMLSTIWTCKSLPHLGIEQIQLDTGDIMTRKELP